MPIILFCQALPSLLISVAGLVIAGWLMDIFQVFEYKSFVAVLQQY